MSTVPADLTDYSDAELIESVRAGTIAAYGTLYERHVHAAQNLARQLARSSAEADDLVSESFAKVLDTLRAGKGPDAAFRAYLLTSLRHGAYDKTRKDRKLDLNEDMATVGGTAGEALTVQFSDSAVAGLERSMAAKAFARLPERWQSVLWHTEIEQQSPAEVAPLLGLTANGVSALAYRAREGLRQAYLQVHLAETSAERCRASAERLGSWTRGGLAKRERAQVESHLDECDRCRMLAAELGDVNGALRAVIAPLVLGGAALGYLATAGAAKASAATAGVAVAGAGAAGSSSGAAANAATSGPRQFVGVAASGVAMAAAITAALAAGGGQSIPSAAPPPPAAAQAPAPPAAPAPAPPAAPAPAPAPPAPPPAPPAPPPAVPAPAPVAPPAPPAQPPAPEPAPPAAPPNVTAQGPSTAIELTPGSDTPTDVPITVRNDGGSHSEPVEATLNLPEGVSAVSSGGGGGGGASGARALPGAGQESSSVDCPAATGDTVTCRSGRGLAPGESVVLTFRLRASQDARPGAVTGSVRAGNLVPVSVTVPIKVAPLPDGLALHAEAAWGANLPWTRHPVVRISARNTGSSTQPVTLNINEPVHLILGGWRAHCDAGAASTSCTSTTELRPGENLRMWVALDQRPDPDDSLVVSGHLGTAEASDTVRFGCWHGRCDEPAPEPPHGPPTPSSTPDPPAPLPPSGEPPSTPSIPAPPTVPPVPPVPSKPSIPAPPGSSTAPTPPPSSVPSSPPEPPPTTDPPPPPATSSSPRTPPSAPASETAGSWSPSPARPPT